MLSAERELEVVRAVDGIADRARTLDELTAGLAAWLSSALDAAEVAIVPVRDGELSLQGGVTPVLARALESVGMPSPEQREGQSGDVVVRALRPGGRLAGLVAVRGAVDEDGRALWRAFEGRADSALEHALEREQLRDRTLELETLYDIDRIRDARLPFAEMLQRAMAAVLGLVRADSAVIALRELTAPSSSLQLHVRAADGMRQETAQFVGHHRAHIEAIVQRAFERRELVSQALAGDGRDMLCAPLILDEEIIGGFVLLASEGVRFSPRDRRLFSAVCSQVDTAIFEDVARQKLRNVFRRYVSRDVVTELLHRQEDFLKGRRAEVTCFFSDLRGFTAVSESLDVDTVVQMLNEHLDAMTAVVFEHGGTVDKFIGDCVMAFFGAPLHQPDHALRAVRCAARMRARHNEIADGWARRGLPAVKIGVGMHSGEVFVGSIGGAALASYTIIGDHVNLASRLEGESGPDDIIISSAVLDAVRDRVDVEERGEVTVKGKTVPAKIYNVLRVR